jgi:nicotinamidase-related amidase
MKKIFSIISILVILTLQLAGQQKEPESKRALIIVDVQEFYFPGGFSPLVEPEKASEKAGEVLDQFRSNDELVVHVKHATKKDSAIHRNVAPRKGEKVVTKRFANSYRETELRNFLIDNKITEVVICGMMTHMCVEATARASADFGYDVIVLDDACATKDVIYDSDTVRAAQVHHSTLGSIDRYYGKVMKTAEFLDR